MIGLIGGTMGLLTGFSILSGVEIVYFLLRFLNSLVYFFKFLSRVFRFIDLSKFGDFSCFRFFISLKIRKSDVVEAVNEKYENHLMRKD